MTARDVFDEVIAERDALQQQVAMLKGAMAAQDERERQAGAVCGVPYELHTCDWPEWVAEEVLSLRQQVATLTEALERIRGIAVHQLVSPAYAPTHASDS